MLMRLTVVNFDQKNNPKSLVVSLVRKLYISEQEIFFSVQFLMEMKNETENRMKYYRFYYQVWKEISPWKRGIIYFF